MSNNQIKIGDFVELCSLQAGVVMKINGDDIQVRVLDDINYTNENFSCCSIKNCGVFKLTWEQVLVRINLGKEKLTEVWEATEGLPYQEYEKRIKFLYNFMLNMNY